MSPAKQEVVKDRERGAVLVWFAFSAVVIIGIGALVIDVGAMWSERRQLTNGADASAMAVGIEAAVNNPGAPIGPLLNTLATTYANENAKDKFSFLEQLCGVGPGLSATAVEVDRSNCSAPAQTANYANWAYVRLRTLTPSNGDQVKFLLAPLLDAAKVGTTLRGAATVAWGITNGIQVVSMVIGQCVFKDAWVQNGILSFPITDSYGPNGRSPVAWMKRDWLDPSCPPQPSSGYPWGWEYSLNKDCRSLIEKVGDEYRLTNSTEGKATSKCKQIVQPNLNKPLVVAIVSGYKKNSETDVCSGQPQDICYYIVKGLATFQFCGYATQGFGKENQCPLNTEAGDEVCPLDDAKQKDGVICGYFVPGSVTEGDILNTVGSPSTGDFGTRVVKFIG